MMKGLASLKVLFKILKLVLAAWDFLSDKYDIHQFKEVIQNIKDPLQQSTSEDDNVSSQATSDIEDSFGDLGT